MDRLGPASDKKLTSGPKTRMCHICGRQYGVNSFEIHLKQCKELWVSRESLKDKSDRKPLPPDPTQGGDPTSASKRSSNGEKAASLDEMNRLASDTFNSVSLSTCDHCGRSFLHEKLLIHNRSCTASNPARRLAPKVDTPDAGATEKKDSPKITPSKSKPSVGKPSQGGTAGQSPSSAPKIPTPSPATATVSKAKSSTAEGSDALAGHIGGTAGRPFRAAANIQNSVSDVVSNDESSDIPEVDSIGDLLPVTNDENIEINQDQGDIILDLERRVEEMESIVAGLVYSISDVKSIIEELKTKNVSAGQ